MKNLIGDIYETIINNIDGTFIRQHIWCYSDGSFSLGDDSGDHEDIDFDEVQEYIKEDQTNEYIEYVAETGEDPLSFFLVDTYLLLNPEFTITCKSWVGQKTVGQRVDSVIIKGTKFEGEYQPSELPLIISEYLQIVKKSESNYIMEDITDDFINDSKEIEVQKIEGGKILKHTGEVRVDRPSDEIKQDLIKLAQKNLNQRV